MGARIDNIMKINPYAGENPPKIHFVIFYKNKRVL